MFLYLVELMRSFSPALLKRVQGLLSGYLLLRTGHRPGVLTNLQRKEMLEAKKTKDSWIVMVSQDF